MEAEAARASYEAREFGRVLREAMRIADRINEAFDAAQPWLLAKDPGARDRLQTVCSVALIGFQQLTVMLAPVLPAVASRVARELFGLGRDYAWSDAWATPARVEPYRHLISRIEPKHDRRAARGSEGRRRRGDGRVGRGSPGGRRRSEAGGSRRDGTRRRAGIDRSGPAGRRRHGDDQHRRFREDRPARGAGRRRGAGRGRRQAAGADAGFLGSPDAQRVRRDQVGHTVGVPGWPPDVVVVANLAPRKMRFGVSEGMVLAAPGPGGADIWVLAPDSGAEPGMQVK